MSKEKLYAVLENIDNDKFVEADKDLKEIISNKVKSKIQSRQLELFPKEDKKK